MGNLPPRPCPKHSGTQGHGFIISDGPQRSQGPFFSPLLTVPAKTPAAPSVLFIKYTVQLCVGAGTGWDGGGGGVTCRGGRHMLLLLYGYLSEERHVLSDWEAIPSCWAAAPWCDPSQFPRSNHGHINRMPPCTTAQVWKTNPSSTLIFFTFLNESYVWHPTEISPHSSCFDFSCSTCGLTAKCTTCFYISTFCRFSNFHEAT